MHQQAFEVVHFESAADAVILLAGAHHEMLQEELAATVEQLRERDFSLGTVEDVFLFDTHPGQCTLFGAELVAQFRERLFLGEQSDARLAPFTARDNAMPERRGCCAAGLGLRYRFVTCGSAFTHGPSSE